MRKRHPVFDLVERAPLQYGRVISGVYRCWYDEWRICGPRVLTWRGRVQPFGAGLTEQDIKNIIADLDSPHRPCIGVYDDSSLGHLADCGMADHALSPDIAPLFDPLPPLHAEYEIEIVYQKPPASPIVRALTPRISVHHYPEMPHPLANCHALCVAYAPEERWTLEHHGAARYADAAVLFLARHTLWLHLRHHVGADAAWREANAAGHTPLDLAQIPVRCPCHCNSGLLYGACCRPHDLLNVARWQRGLPPIPRWR